MARKAKKTTARRKTTTKRKTTARKTTARKTTARKAATKRKPARKAAAKKTATRKTAKRKTTARKTATRKTTARKTTVRKAKPKLTIGKKAFKKSQVFDYIAGATELSKKEVAGVFEALGEVMQGHLKKAGPQEFTVPGLMKCKVTRKPATKARRGINPFTGEEMTFKAKPARNVVKVRPLKNLKEMAEK